MAVLPIEARVFTNIEQVAAFEVLGEKIGVHDVATVSVARGGIVVWEKAISSAFTIDCMTLPNPLFDRSVRSAEIKAGQKAAVMNFLNGRR